MSAILIYKRKKHKIPNQNVYIIIMGNAINLFLKHEIILYGGITKTYKREKLNEIQ